MKIFSWILQAALLLALAPSPSFGQVTLAVTDQFMVTTGKPVSARTCFTAAWVALNAANRGVVATHEVKLTSSCSC